MIAYDPREMERRTSAVTLSDMEMFIFPELMYSLVLANIMSPRIWLWRDNQWFAGLEGMSPYRRVSKLKQYIMDNYIFNLDLDTWGLTTKERELARFSDFISEFSDLLGKFCVDFNKFSNLLFKFGNTLDIELFFFRSQFSSSRHLLWLLSGERGPPLEKISIVQGNRI